jgi:hypothetical protein
MMDGKYNCYSCKIAVVCVVDKSGLHSGELAQQVDARLCTRCWRRLHGQKPQGIAS